MVRCSRSQQQTDQSRTDFRRSGVAVKPQDGDCVIRCPMSTTRRLSCNFTAAVQIPCLLLYVQISLATSAVKMPTQINYTLHQILCCYSTQLMSSRSANADHAIHTL